MTPYLLIAFILAPNGEIRAESFPHLLMGADLCHTVMIAKARDYAEQGIGASNVRLVCVDTKLYAGVPT